MAEYGFDPSRRPFWSTLLDGASGASTNGVVDTKGFGGVLIEAFAANASGTLSFQVCGDSAASAASLWIPAWGQNVETGGWTTAPAVSTMASGALYSIATFGADAFRVRLTTSIGGTVTAKGMQLGGVQFTNPGVNRAS